MQRRNFLQSLASVPLITSESIAKTNPIIKPARLKVGDTIGLVCPAAPAFSREGVKITAESLQALGFKVKYGKLKRLLFRYGSIELQQKREIKSSLISLFIYARFWKIRLQTHRSPLNKCSQVSSSKHILRQ
jgi:hypothetical protein